MQLAAEFGRTAGHQLDHLDLLLLEAQHGADALQGETHLDVEVLGGARRKVRRVWIEAGRDSVHVELEHVAALVLGGTPQAALVALDQRLASIIQILAGQMQLQQLVLDPLAPEIVQLGPGLGPAARLGLEFQALVDLEAQLALQLCLEPGGALGQPLQVDVEDRVGRFEFARFQVIVQAVTVALEALDIAGQEIAAIVVQRIQVGVEDIAGLDVVQWFLAVVVVGQQVGDGLVQLPLLGDRMDRGDAGTHRGIVFGERALAA